MLRLVNRPRARAITRAWQQDKALPAGETFTLDFGELGDRFVLGDPARVLRSIRRRGEKVLPHVGSG